MAMAGGGSVTLFCLFIVFWLNGSMFILYRRPMGHQVKMNFKNITQEEESTHRCPT